MSLKRTRDGEVLETRESKRLCRRKKVHFEKDVKTHDGLRPESLIFEEVRRRNVLIK